MVLCLGTWLVENRVGAWKEEGWKFGEEKKRVRKTELVESWEQKVVCMIELDLGISVLS